MLKASRRRSRRPGARATAPSRSHRDRAAGAPPFGDAGDHTSANAAPSAPHSHACVVIAAAPMSPERLSREMTMIRQTLCASALLAQPFAAGRHRRRRQRGARRSCRGPAQRAQAGDRRADPHARQCRARPLSPPARDAAPSSASARPTRWSRSGRAAAGIPRSWRPISPRRRHLLRRGAAGAATATTASAG